MMGSIARIIGFMVALLAAGAAQAEQLCPKYGSCVPAENFECHEIARSSLVTRVCYDQSKHYMVVRLKMTDYNYCEVGRELVNEFISAKSMGTFYNSRIKVSSNAGQFDCRTHAVPTY